MSIVWEERPGHYAQGDKAQGAYAGNHMVTIGLIVVLAVAAGSLLATMDWPQRGPALQAAEASAIEVAPAPVAPTAQRIAAEPETPAEQPLPDGSSRFALDAPAGAAMSRTVLAKNWRPAGTRGQGIDAARTASIGPLSAAAGGVAVAESEDDVVKMETELAAAGSGEFDVPAAPDMVPGRALKWVNMRSGPDNDAEVITVVPFDAALEVEKGCTGWCAVSYDGQKGYIYNTLVGYDE